MNNCGLTIHELKTWKKYFNDVWEYRKFFEIRRNDRDFKVGDFLRLMEYDHETKEFTGRECTVEVKFILHGDTFGVQTGYCVMSIQRL